MLSFDTRPAITVDRAAPIARLAWCWPALVTGIAVVLDALWPVVPGSGGVGVLWIDGAALVCVLWAVTGERRVRRADWATPVDGRVLSGFMLAVLHVVRLQGAIEPALWLHQIAASGVCFYALTARLRREQATADGLWPVFALLTLVLSAVTLGPLTQGTEAFAERMRSIDAHWVSRYGLGKTLLLVTVLCAGRASEPDARVLWRVTAIVGALACLTHLFMNGMGLGISALGSLDEPFYFGTSIVAFILLAGLARMAWRLHTDRPEEAGRWRAMTAVFVIVIALLLFGGTTGGEGVRAVAAMAGVATLVAQVAPRAAVARPRPRMAEAAAARTEPPASRAA